MTKNYCVTTYGVGGAIECDDPNLDKPTSCLCGKEVQPAHTEAPLPKASTPQRSEASASSTSGLA